MGVFDRPVAWLKNAGASILRTPVRIVQRHQNIVCLMLEEDCSSTFSLPSKMLGADEAAIFVVTVVFMALVMRLRRGGRFIEDQVCDEDGAGEDAEDEEDAAAATREAAEENKRVANMEDENSILRSWNELLCGEVSALRDQRELAQAAQARARQRSRNQQSYHAKEVELLKDEQQQALDQRDEEHRNEVAATERGHEEELASVRQQHRESLAQENELLATSNSDNVVLNERAASAERTVDELRREKVEATRAAAQQQRGYEEELASVRHQHRESLAQANDLLATSNSDNVVLIERAASAERTVDELRREKVEATRAAAQQQEEQELVSARLQEENQERLAAVQERLVTSQSANSALSGRAAAAEHAVEELRRENVAATRAAAQRQQDHELAAVRLHEQYQEKLAAVEDLLVGSQNANSALSERAAAAEHAVEEMRRRAEEGTEQRETPAFNVDVPEASATPSTVQEFQLAGYEEMATHTKPVVQGIKPWSDDSVMITVDDCGNCYQSSWFLVTILWATQCPRRLRQLISKLLHGYDQDGALVHVPPHYQPYVEAVFQFLMTMQKSWGYHTSNSGNDADHDNFGVRQAVNIVQMLTEVPSSEGGSNEESLQLKRGIAIVARCFDVWWANCNDFPDMDVVATLHRSMEFDVGLELTLMSTAREAAVESSHHSPSPPPPYEPKDTMRPACSLGYIVGMAMDEAGNNGHANRTDLTGTFARIANEAAEAQGRPNHANIAGMLVWKASCPHYNVLVQSGPVANALASRFGLDLSEGDAIARDELAKGSRWQRDNAMGIESVIGPEELAQLRAQAEEAEAAASNPHESATAAATPASSPASLAASNLNDAQWPLPAKNGRDLGTAKQSKRKRKKKK